MRDDRIQGAGLLEEMTGTGHDHELLRCDQMG
jgi:hypothetical protein